MLAKPAVQTIGDIEQYITSSLVAGSKNMTESVMGYLRSLVLEGNEDDTETTAPPDGMISEVEGALKIHMGKFAEWCSQFAWLEVPPGSDDRAKWLLAYQHGKDYVKENVAKAWFGEDGSTIQYQAKGQAAEALAAGEG